MRKLGLKRERTAKIYLNPIGRVDLTTGGDAGGFGYAEDSYNFDCSRGELDTAVGAVDFFDGEEVDAVKYYFYKRRDPVTGNADDRIMFYSTDGKVYEFSDGSPVEVNGLSYQDAPVGVCYNLNGADVIVFSSKSGDMKIYNGSYVTPVSDAPPVTSMAIHYERLFITGGDDDTLWFSDDFDPTNWNLSVSEAGFIDLADGRGEVLKCVSFEDYLFVFRRYGITRVTAFADQTEFSAAGLYVSSGKIYPDSVTLCGDCILFFASDGVYRFNGVSAVKISAPFFAALDATDENVSGRYYDGYAYFNVTAKGEEKKRILRIDPHRGDFCFLKGLDPKDILLVAGTDEYALLVHDGEKNAPVRIINDGTGVLGDETECFWKSKETDFGLPIKNKRLAEIKFSANAPVTVKVVADGKESEYADGGSGGIRRIRPDARGDRFSVSFKSVGSGIRISDVELTFRYYL